MKIIILVDDQSRLGGVEIYATRLKSVLLQLELVHDVEILSAVNIQMSDKFETDVLLVQHISPFYFDKFKCINAKYKVWCFHNNPSALVLDAMSCKFWPLNKFYAAYSVRILRKFYTQIIYDFDHIVFQHTDFKGIFSKIVGQSNLCFDISVIPNFWSTDSSFVGKLWEDREYDILVLGRLEIPQKRVDLLPSILSYVDCDKIAVVGAGSMRDWLKGQLQGPEFSFFDWVDSPGAFYSNSRILLLSSQYEGYGMVLDEALQHGCLPVCFDIGGPIDRFRHLASIKVPFGDVENMSKILSRLARDKDEWQRLVDLSSDVDIHAHNEYVKHMWCSVLELA